MSRVDAFAFSRLPLPLLVRAGKFAAVGGFCFLLQYGLLVLFVRSGMAAYPTAANSIAFMVSAQVNFLLSRNLTWRDRRLNTDTLSHVAWQAAQYNMTALASLAVNSAVFWVTNNASHQLLLAVACGNGAGMVFTYLVLNKLVFRTVSTPKV